jgi:hypothetical protein
MEHGDLGKTEVESAAAFVIAIRGHPRLVAGFDHAAATLIDYTDTPTPETRARESGPSA